MCSVNKGDLPIKIWWTLSESEHDFPRNLSTNDGVVIAQTGNKLSVLNIESVNGRHRGNYSCHAKNKAGIVHHSAYLAINGDSFKFNLTNHHNSDLLNFGNLFT